MRLPNGDRAIVEDRKLIDYVLSTEHPVGKHHALLFQRLLGIGPQQAPLLKSRLLAAAAADEAVPGQPTSYGQKFVQRLTMTGQQGERVVLAVWLIDVGQELPRLITCYVE